MRERPAPHQCTESFHPSWPWLEGVQGRGQAFPGDGTWDPGSGVGLVQLWETRAPNHNRFRMQQRSLFFEAGSEDVRWTSWGSSYLPHRSPEMDSEPVTCLGTHHLPRPSARAPGLHPSFQRLFHTRNFAPLSCPQTLGSPTQDTARGSEPWVPAPHKPPKPGQSPATRRPLTQHTRWQPLPGLRGPLPATHHALSCQRRGATDPGDTETAASKAWDRPHGSGQGRRCAPELCGPAPA